MKQLVSLVSLMGFAVIALSAFAASAFAADYMPVTDARLLSPEPENWLMYRGTYDSHGYSPLKKIHAGNVEALRPLWSFSTGLREGHQAPPIVNNGFMFITTPHNHLLALDAGSGELIWRYIRELPEDQVQMHPTNRGVGLYGDLVFMATADCYVVALDAKTGAVVWETEVEDYAAGYYMTLAPLVADGKVMVGVSGGEFGIRGFVAALDARTGETAWKTYTIPAPGEPGSESWPGDTWKTGGVPVWITGSFDPETDLTYWGTGNGGPWMGDTRDGDNLYANSVIALDVTTGAIRGHHQYHWNDSWDWDEVSAPLLIDFERAGRTVRGLVHPGRNGYLWFLERQRDGITFVDAQPYVKQDVFTALDPVTGRPTYDETKKPGTGKGATFCPSHWGGKDWPPAAFSPRTFAWHGGQEVALRYNRRNVLGFSMDFAKDVSKTNWGMEFTWIEGQPFSDSSQPEHITYTDTLNLTISVDRPTFINFMNANRTFFFNSQWFFQYQTNHNNRFLANGPFNALFTFAVFTGYFQDRLLPTFITVYDFNSQSGGVLPSMTYRFTDVFSIDWGFLLFFGKTQLKPMDINPIGPPVNRAGPNAYMQPVDNLLSLVRARDEVYLRLRYTF